MSSNGKLPKRRSPRLPNFDYSSDGLYYVTICMEDRQPVFGRVIEGEMQLSPLGEIVRAEWNKLVQRFPTIQLDEYIIMPDHLHGIIEIQHQQKQAKKQPGLREMLGPFRGASSYFIHKTMPEFEWQKDCYEHIIRNQQDLDEKRRYIIENPIRHWLKMRQEWPDKPRKSNEPT